MPPKLVSLSEREKVRSRNKERRRSERRKTEGYRDETEERNVEN